MPELERWEQKAIGRIDRFENYTGELLGNRAYEGARAGLNSAVKGFMGIGRWFTGLLRAPAEAQVIAGKKFTEKTMGLAKRTTRKVVVAAANKAINGTEKAVDTFLTRKHFFVKGPNAASALFGGHITLDRELGWQMYNACGYEPGYDRILKELYDQAAEVKKGFSDITWREEVVPHLLRTAFQKEMTSCLDFIREKHRQHPEIYNRQLMQTQMNAAVRHLGDIFEKFTLDLANKTDFLEAPITFLPQKTESHDDVAMTPEEREALAAVPRLSMFESEKAVQKQIAAASEKLPALSAKDALDKFKTAISKPVPGPEGVETPYQNGIDTVEDEHRLITGVLNLREMMRKYERRNFFTRWLTREGRAERKAIGEMKAALLETLHIKADRLDTLLDLNTPLEQNVDMATAMNIPQKPKPEKTLGDQVSEVMEKTNEVIRDVTGATLDVAGKVITTTKNIIMNPIQTATETVEFVENAASEIGAAISDTVNDVKKTVDFSSDFADMDWSDGLGDEDDDLFDRDKRAAPVKPEPVEPVQEEKQPDPVQEETEKKEQEESKQEEPVQEGMGTQVWNAVSYAAGAVTSTVTNTVSTAASWLNLFNYSIFGGGKKAEAEPVEIQEQQQKSQIPEAKPADSPEQLQESQKTEAKPAEIQEQQQKSQIPEAEPADPLERLQKRQMDVAKEIMATEKEKVTGMDYYTAFAKLLYYKTLEISLTGNGLSEEKLSAALSKETVDQNVNQLVKDPALKKLNKFEVKKGFVSRLREFLDEVSRDPSVVNEIHKDYIQKREALNAKKPAQSKDSVQQNEPEKAVSINVPKV